jgi:hypothetical protein
VRDRCSRSVTRRQDAPDGQGDRVSRDRHGSTRERRQAGPVRYEAGGICQCMAGYVGSSRIIKTKRTEANVAGYHSMCRFYAVNIFWHPRIRKLDYYSESLAAAGH